MNTESREPRVAERSRLQRAIVLQLLRDDREQRWSRAELAGELDADALTFEQALGELDADGVVCLAEGEVWASQAARRLDQLELIGV
jgi:hypothetical protein